MKILWNLLKSMKPSIMIIFVVLWNLLFFYADRLNGADAQIANSASALVMATACFSLAIVGFASILSSRARALTLRSGADFADARPGLILIAAVGSVLFIALLGVALFGVGASGAA